MGTFAAGQVVIVRFPFSDLSASKVRPAVVLADAGRGDWILCQVTSQPYGDPSAITLDTSDFASGALRLTSYVRPGKLFTANAGIMMGQLGEISASKQTAICDAVVRMIRRK